MNSSEDSEPENGIHSEDYRMDDKMREIEMQLGAEAERLVSLYPPSESSRLEKLITHCLEVEGSKHVESKDSVDSSPVLSDKVGPEDSNQNAGLKKADSLPHRSWWYHAASLASIAVLLVGSFAYIWNQPGKPTVQEPLVSNQTEPDLSLVPTVSVSTLRPEILQASQPQLEAMYDEMPLEPTSIEF